MITPSTIKTATLITIATTVIGGTYHNYATNLEQTALIRNLIKTNTQTIKLIDKQTTTINTLHEIINHYHKQRETTK